MSRLSSWLLTAIAMATAASYWLYIHTGQRDSVPYAAAQKADLTIRQPRWTLFDGQGDIATQLHAQRLQRWAGEQAARLIQPRLSIWDQQQRLWRVHARSGRIYPANQPLLLEQEVIMRQEPETDGLLLQTTRLRIDRNGDSVETDEAVVLPAGSWHFTATGMRANLGRQRLELLAQVRGIHE